jgi:hypothetical protein
VDSSASTPKSASRSALEHNASDSCVDACRTDQGGGEVPPNWLSRHSVDPSAKGI